MALCIWSEVLWAGYIFYAACENIRKANILLLAGPKLDARIVNDMGIRKYDRMEDIMADVDIKGKDGFTTIKCYPYKPSFFMF